MARNESAAGQETGAATLRKGARITGEQRGSLGAAFAERYAAGESIRAIAEDAGRSYGFVHGVLTESGAALRARGGATRRPGGQGDPEPVEVKPKSGSDADKKKKGKRAAKSEAKSGKKAAKKG